MCASIEHVFAQESLFDAGGDPVVDRDFATLRRRELSDGAWLDLAPRWLSGDSSLFDDLAQVVQWTQPEQRMYDRMVTTPRLVARFGPEAHPVVAGMAEALGERYGCALDRISANWYRDGDDSVAWHGDRVARDLPTATVATVSLRGPREFRFRPADGGRSERLSLGHGDLVVMGGSFQRTWRHAVPKATRPVPARIVVMFRHAYD